MKRLNFTEKPVTIHKGNGKERQTRGYVVEPYDFGELGYKGFKLVLQALEVVENVRRLNNFVREFSEAVVNPIKTEIFTDLIGCIITGEPLTDKGKELYFKKNKLLYLTSLPFAHVLDGVCFSADFNLDCYVLGLSEDKEEEYGEISYLFNSGKIDYTEFLNRANQLKEGAPSREKEI
ncbi:MAG: hypothetical protein Q4B43_10525 [Bacteroidota bacterium]|nr:hypothetical protein [Bacteroidota bacterium]